MNPSTIPTAVAAVKVGQALSKDMTPSNTPLVIGGIVGSVVIVVLLLLLSLYFCYRRWYVYKLTSRGKEMQLYEVYDNDDFVSVGCPNCDTYITTLNIENNDERLFGENRNSSTITDENAIISSVNEDLQTENIYPDTEDLTCTYGINTAVRKPRRTEYI